MRIISKNPLVRCRKRERTFNTIIKIIAGKTTIIKIKNARILHICFLIYDLERNDSERNDLERILLYAHRKNRERAFLLQRLRIRIDTETIPAFRSVRTRL